uniref:Coiled-coil domain-containing protein 134 n=1 Tax=Plectus sambesii TaxID=2011161 RepID=A0A914X4R5_9BILA
MSDHDGEKPVAPSDQPADVGSDAKQPNSDKSSDSSSGPDSAKVYQKLFKHKRAEQNEAVKTILNMPDVKKRTKLVEQLVTAIHKVIGDSKLVVESAGFTPGDPLPTDKSAVRDGISQVLENAAFFAELALRFPKQISQLYMENRKLQVLVNWAIGFSHATGFYDSTTTELIHLASQELGIIPREENFVNPYRNAQSKQEAAMTAAEQLKQSQRLAMAKENERKKLAKKTKKGPRMSGRTEL